VTAVTSTPDGSTRPAAHPPTQLSARTRGLSRAAARALASRTDSTTPPDVGTATRVCLVAVLTVLTVELVRASGPLLDRAFSDGVGAVGATALGAYAAAGVVATALLLATGRRFTGSPDGRTVLAGTAAVALARLVVQGLDDEARYVAGLVTVALAVGVLTLTVSFVAGRAAGGRQAALGLVLGSGLATGLQLSLGTWDAFWRRGTAGWVVVGVLTVGAVGLAYVVRTHDSTGRPRRLWVLGPFLALATMVLANPAFAAAQTGEPLHEVGLVLVVAHVVAVWLLLSPHLLTMAVRVTAALAVPVAVAGSLFLTGTVGLVAIVVLQLAVGVALATGLTTHRIAPLGIPGTALATGVVGLGLVVPLLVHLVGYDLPLGLDNRAVPVAAGLALTVAGLRRRVPARPGAATATDRPVFLEESPQPFRSNAIRMLVTPAVVLAVAGWWPSSAAGPVPALARGDSFVVLDWNLHHGVEPATDVDPERIARTIEAQDPDVVTLQEVSRGWVLGGGLDLATWLSRRLGMQVVFAPAADRQLGNAILARSALTDPVVAPLPYGAGPQQRSAISATVTLADGTAVRVTSVQLQDGDENAPTRLDELRTLLATLPAGGAAVFAGDLSAGPGSPEVDLLDTAGWTGAIDVGGDPAPTYPSDDPQSRIDWVLGQGLQTTHAEVLTAPRSSDHLPVVVTLEPAG
jgi:endonuclease/exonuclease/phosphatase family metal-dependent hydrolase